MGTSPNRQANPEVHDNTVQVQRIGKCQKADCKKEKKNAGKIVNCKKSEVRQERELEYKLHTEKHRTHNTTTAQGMAGLNQKGVCMYPSKGLLSI